MAKEHTLSIIKPDAVGKHHIGEIMALFEGNGLRIAAARLERLSTEKVVKVYGIHKGRPYYEDLLAFMTSGPCMLLVLEGDNAVVRNREIMGSTNPKESAPGTIRALFATATNRNAVHGSDSVENAEHEIAILFEPREVYGSDR
jgi:nucleoside-diphosphate kinase